MPSCACERFIRECKARFPGLTYQVYNRRKIAGSSRWSQHAYANAVDIFGPVRMLDQVAAWARARPDSANVLWRVRNHYDHVHADFHPQGVGTPPMAQPQCGEREPKEEGWAERMETVRQGDRHPNVATLQALLNGTAEIERTTWPHVDVDGVFGGHTHNVLLMYQHSRGLSADGVAGPITWKHLLAL